MKDFLNITCERGRKAGLQIFPNKISGDILQYTT